MADYPSALHGEENKVQGSDHWHPNFVIVGAQKSASTFLHRCLEEHPEVYSPSQELRFFENPEFLTARIEKLEALFKEHADKLLRGIKRPDYLGKPEYLFSVIYKNEKPKLSEVFKRELYAFYERDIAGLEGLLGTSLEHWKVE